MFMLMYLSQKISKNLSSRSRMPHRLWPFRQGRCRQVLLSFLRSVYRGGLAHAGVVASRVTSGRASDRFPMQLLVSSNRACSLKNRGHSQDTTTFEEFDSSHYIPSSGPLIKPNTVKRVVVSQCLCTRSSSPWPFISCVAQLSLPQLHSHIQANPAIRTEFAYKQP
jgi:hypothetical protein